MKSLHNVAYRSDCSQTLDYQGFGVNEWYEEIDRAMGIGSRCIAPLQLQVCINKGSIFRTKRIIVR